MMYMSRNDANTTKEAREWIQESLTIVEVFLTSYLKSTNEKPLNSAETEKMARLINVSVAYGTSTQKCLLYLLLIHTRNQLSALERHDLHQPISRLAQFFKSQCPHEAQQLEDSLSNLYRGSFILRH